MGDKNQNRISRVSTRHESEDPRNRSRRRKTNKQQDQNKAQTLEMEEDRISVLPDSLLIHILSLLPSIEDVIRTGTLSKRWLHLWTFVPNLLFTSVDLSSPNDSCERFVSYINRTLVQSRVSKIEKFSIRLIPYCVSIASDVDSWIHFATKNNVDHLALAFINMNDDDGYDDFYILPQHLYTDFSLKMLELASCIIDPVGLIRWKSLKSLCLQHVKLINDVMEGILLGCPVLEILEVRNYCGFNRLKVTSPSLRELVLSSFECSFYEDDDDNDGGDAYLAISTPNLRTLTISSYFYTSNVHLEDVKSLVVADLSFHLGIDYDVYDNVIEEDKYCDLLQELIEKLRHVKELKLGTWCIQVLSVVEVKALPSALLNCKSLTLDMRVVDNDLPGIAKLLDISPYLETLVIDKENLYHTQSFVQGCLFDADSIDRQNYVQLRKTIPEGLLLHLKNVEIFGFRSGRSEVELVQFLLKNGKVLENMNIYLQTDAFQCLSDCCCAWREIVNKKLNLPAPSPCAVIRLFESPKHS